jgi:hypothetical protein
MVINTSRGSPETRVLAVPVSVPPVLCWVSGKVCCQLPVSCVLTWERLNRSIPRPARLSCIVPVHVPVKLLGVSSLEQPRRTTARAAAHHHGLHRMETPFSRSRMRSVPKACPKTSAYIPRKSSGGGERLLTGYSPPVPALSPLPCPRYWAVEPPSMTSSLPVTNDDSSEARYNTP